MNENNLMIAQRDQAGIISENPDLQLPLDRVRDVRKYDNIKKIAIISAIVLGVLLAIYFSLVALVNPMERLVQLMEQNQSFRVWMVGSYQGRKSEVIMTFAGNFFTVEERQNFNSSGIFVKDEDIKSEIKYYEIDGEKIYEYTRYKNQWRRDEIDREELGVNDVVLDQSNSMFDPSNYKNDTYNIFVWAMDPYVDIDHFYNVKAQNKFCSIEMSAYYSKAKIKMTFDSFGSAQIELPWIEEGATVEYVD